MSKDEFKSLFETITTDTHIGEPDKPKETAVIGGLRAGKSMFGMLDAFALGLRKLGEGDTESVFDKGMFEAMKEYASELPTPPLPSPHPRTWGSIGKSIMTSSHRVHSITRNWFEEMQLNLPSKPDWKQTPTERLQSKPKSTERQSDLLSALLGSKDQREGITPKSNGKSGKVYTSKKLKYAPKDFGDW